MTLFKLFLIATIVSSNWGFPITCRLGSELFNAFIDEPYTGKAGYGVDRAIGVISINDAFPEHNLTKEEFEACFKKYFQDPRVPSKEPYYPHLAYKQPSYLGKKPSDMPIPEPPSSYSIPIEGYTTYQHPHNFNEKSTEKPLNENISAPNWYQSLTDDVADLVGLDDWF